MDEERWIATRVLRSAEQGRTITVRIGVPVQVDEHYAMCPVVVDGEMGRTHVDGHGVDSLQALLVGLSGVRYFLLRSHPDFFWEIAGDGDSGFPRLLLEGSLDYRRGLDDIVNEYAHRDLEMAVSRAAGKA